MKKLRHGRYSPNGWTIFLSCRSPGPVSGIPDDDRVRRHRVVAGVARRGKHTADQNRRLDRVDRHRDLVGGVLVGQWVDIRRVLRPDDEQRLRCPPRAHVVGQPHRLPHVVVEHRPALSVEVQPELRHIALHCSDVDRRFVGGARPRMPDRRRDRGGGDQHEADAGAWQNDRGRRRAWPAVPAASPPVDDLEGQRGEPEAEQRHGERHQRRPADLCQ